MPSKLNAYLLSALMVAAALQCAPGAPVADAPTDSPAGDSSGEEGESAIDAPRGDWEGDWEDAIAVTKRHQKEFEDEFHIEVQAYELETHNTPSLPKTCPEKSSKEACLRWLAQGLLTYTALLKHVEKESPSSIRSEGPSFRSLLLKLTSGIKNKMRHSEHVKALTSSQEGQLLRDFDSPDSFQRLMTTFKILYKLRNFLIDGIKNIRKKTIVWPMGVRYQYTTNNYKSITNQL